jgi:SAM-dependent methyltransferase
MPYPSFDPSTFSGSPASGPARAAGAASSFGAAADSSPRRTFDPARGFGGGRSTFAGTADAYAAHRAPLPEDVVSYLRALLPSGRRGRLLDVGTGTGAALLPLLPAVSSAIGIDPDAHLLDRTAATLSGGASGADVELRAQPAEAFTVPTGWQADLVTVCRAFHWFDRPAFLERVTPVMNAGASLAVLSDHSVWSDDQPWKSAVIGVITEFLGPRRRAGDGFYEPPARPFVEDIRASGLQNVVTVEFPFRRTLTVEDMLGELRSSSFASRAVLGRAHTRFESRLREALAPVARADGRLVDDNVFTVIVAERP